MEYQRLYYTEGRSPVSDREFDRLVDRLGALEREHPELAVADSPTLRVGSDLTNDFPEVEHTWPMLSLDKAYSVDGLLAWLRRVEDSVRREFRVSVEEKLDGVSIVLTYVSGLLQRAVTRGNGRIGNDVTPNVRTIRDVPLRLARPLSASVRGEIFLSRPDFQRINRTMDPPFANPRNLAAGTLRRVKSADVARIPLRFFAYEAIGDGLPDSHVDLLAELKDSGLPINPASTSFASGDGAETVLKQLVANAAARRGGLDWEIDGLVLKLDDRPAREAMGETAHHPRWAIAYKFDSPLAESVVRGIDVQIGRTGRATPVARIEPTPVGGTTVSNITLHNQAYVDALDLDRGDRVAISRRGDVIPAVEQVLEKAGSGRWLMPERCPVCGQPLQVDGAHHFCVNWDCPARQLGRLQFFVARDQLDIDGFGPETIAVLTDRGLLSDLPDLYHLDWDAILALEGFGQKRIELMQAGLVASRSRPYRRVLAALGIPDLGPKAVELILGSGLHDVDELLRLSDAEDAVARLADIPGIGERTAQSILAGLRHPRYRDCIARLREAGLQFSESAGRADTGTEGPLVGTVWAVTGSFAEYNPRSRAMDRVKALGGRTVSALSGTVTHLLAGEGAGSKLQKARDLGVRIVTEAEFREMVGEA